MKAHGMALMAIAAFAGIDAAKANDVPAMEVIVVTAERVEQPAKQVKIATDASAPAIDFTGLTIQAPELDPPATDEARRRIELATGNRSSSKT